MTFKPDSVRFRTWDPNTGWELTHHWCRFGEAEFTLSHSTTGESLSCRADYRVQDTGESTADGKRIARFEYHSHSINRWPFKPSDEQKDLIEQALYAYGLAHNGPLGPVLVTYGDDGAR